MMHNDEISNLVKATLEAKIIQAFRDTPEAIDELVKACLSKEVDQFGGKPDYHTKNKMPYLSYLAQTAIEQVARQAVNEYISEISPNLTALVKQALADESVVEKFVQAFTETTRYGVAVSVNVDVSK